MSQYRDDYNYDREAPAPQRAPADRPRSSGGRSTGGNVRGGSGSSRTAQCCPQYSRQQTAKCSERLYQNFHGLHLLCSSQTPVYVLSIAI